MQYNFKDTSYEQFHTYIRDVPALLKKIGATENYACA